MKSVFQQNMVIINFDDREVNLICPRLMDLVVDEIREIRIGILKCNVLSNIRQLENLTISPDEVWRKALGMIKFSEKVDLAKLRGSYKEVSHNLVTKVYTQKIFAKIG